MAKSLTITVRVGRQSGRGGNFVATACVRGRGRQYRGPDSNKSHACETGLGRTPTRATAQALSLLSEALKSGPMAPDGRRSRASAVNYARQKLTRVGLHDASPGVSR